MMAAAAISPGVAQAQFFAANRLPSLEHMLVRVPSFQVSDLAAYDLSGEKISISQASRVGLVLNLWATWCGPCLAEMPTFGALARNLSGTGIQVLHIACESGNRERVARHIGDLTGYSGPVYVSRPGRAVPKTLAVEIFPYTLLIRDQMVMSAAAGAADWGTGSAAEMVKAALGR
jgi:thiol-disulfide isomerase/thioredoxin